jgi:hypothetical protein
LAKIVLPAPMNVILIIYLPLSGIMLRPGSGRWTVRTPGRMHNLPIIAEGA